MSQDSPLSPFAKGPGAPVLYDKEGPIAVVTLNRPDVLNAYNVAMRDALFEILQAVRDDPEVRVMALRGNGRAFCSGGDVSEFGTAPSPVAAREVRWRRDVWGLLWSLPKITLAAVHGAVAGSGFEMVLLCDLCVASRNARFFLPETGLGMIPGVGGTQTAARHLGLGRGMDLVLTGRWLRASELRRLGIVSELVDPSQLCARALARAREVAALPPRLAAAVKHAVNEGWDRTLDEGLRLERRLGSMKSMKLNRWSIDSLTH
jgi:enoyl-CoA hydratase/carnithine racemase